MKSVTQNIRGFIERLLRAAQRVLGSRMRPSKQWLRTTDLDQLSCSILVGWSMHFSRTWTAGYCFFGVGIPDRQHCSSKV